MPTPPIAADEPSDRLPDDLDIAAALIGGALLAAGNVIHDRQTDPDAFPAYGSTPDDWHAIGRRAVAALLEEGWTPPGKYSPREAVPDAVPATWTRPRRRTLTDRFLSAYARLITLRPDRTPDHTPDTDPGE